MSSNKEIGVLPPGPINNNNLFIIVKESDDDRNSGLASLAPTEMSATIKIVKTHQLRNDLTLNLDYRGVNKDVW